MSARRTTSFAVLAVPLLALAVFTPFWGNLWLTVTDREYRVPADSSLFDIQSTQLNSGSGGWWLYGEDADHYYAFTGTGTPPYRSFDREAARACRVFVPLDQATWCQLSPRTYPRPQSSLRNDIGLPTETPSVMRGAARSKCQRQA